MNSRSGILAGGNWIIDHVKTIDSWPPEDSLVNIVSEFHSNGGAPYNVLKNLSKLGAGFPLQAIGLLGDDRNGDAIAADCRQCGIDMAQLRRTAGAATSYTDVMTVRATGRRTFFHQRGANACLLPRHFHLGYLLLLDELDRLEHGVPRAAGVLRRARSAGLTTSVDLVSENSDRFAAVVRPALPEVDVLFANDFEAERLTGRPLRRDGRIDRARVEEAARELVGQGVRDWVILHFAEGACAVSARGERHWQPSLLLPPGEIRGTAGAGDAFASGVLYSLHSGRGLGEALRLGVCVAAGSLTHPTCSEGVRPAADSMRLDERWGFRTIGA